MGSAEFWEALRPALLALVAASLLGAAIGVAMPGRAYRRLREDVMDADAFDSKRTLWNKVLIFQVTATTGVPYAAVTVMLVLVYSGALSGEAVTPALPGALPQIGTALLGLAAANCLGGGLKGALAARQVETIAQKPETFGRCYLIALLPEMLQIAALLFAVLAVIRI